MWRTLHLHCECLKGFHIRSASGGPGRPGACQLLLYARISPQTPLQVSSAQEELSLRALSLTEPQAKVHRASPSGRHASQELWARGAGQMAAPPCQPRVAGRGLGQVARLKRSLSWGSLPSSVKSGRGWVDSVFKVYVPVGTK